MRQRSITLCIAILLTALATASCAPVGRPTGAPYRAGSGSADHGRPSNLGFTDVAAPALQHTDLTLPAGCTLEDYTDALAAYTRMPDAPRTTDAIGLLDLSTGRHADVLLDAVNASAGWDVFAPRLSDRVVAWEEVTPGEGDDMGHAGWRLYAASIDRQALTIARPTLVAEGRTETQQRPF
jgi:hypothetical protein